MKWQQLLARINNHVRSWLATRWFWRATLILFVLQASYVAIVGRFSMAFDEYYHLGTIQAYAKVWLPWSVQQPPGDAPIGAITADGSYLYHYLMSFPYRVIQHLTSSEMAQVIMLRFIDIGIVVAGLYVFRRILLRLGLSRWLTHAVLFFLTLLPMAPFLTGQLTYDSLWFTMTAVSMLVMLQLLEQLRKGKLPLRLTALMLSLLFLTSQVKYAFLPMALAGGVFFIVYCIRQARTGKLVLKTVWQKWRAELRKPLGIGAVVLLLVSGTLFAVRYGTNIVQYHHPVPACDAVLSTEQCMAYGPFGRDENHRQLNLADDLTIAEKAGYPLGWYHHMVWESYFAVGPKEADYPTGQPLPVAYRTGFTIAILVTFVVLTRIRYIWRRGLNDKLLLVLTGTYVLFLFGNNYQAYLTTGAPVAIHGRYLLPLLPLIAYLFYGGLRSYRAWKKYAHYGPAIVGLLLLLTLYGGGIVPFILRSNEDWYWSWAESMSDTVRSVFWPIIYK